MMHIFNSYCFRLLCFNKQILLLSFLILNLTIASSQQKDTLLIWDTNYLLTWDDFMGKEINNTNNPDALSYLELPLLISYDSNKKPIYTVVALFNRYKSFTSKFHYSLLDHEQQHFNILEIFARKIRKSVDALNKVENTTPQDIFNLYYEYQDSITNHQHRYDVQTDYSRNWRKQKIWNLIIKNKLQELENYSVKNYYNLNN